MSAPSGAGKTTLCQRLSASVSGLKHSVSYTTRPIRKGEVNNRDYTFVSKRVFLGMVKKKKFVEWAKVHGHLYGTSRERLEKILNKGINVILDIDTQGAVQIRKIYPGGIYIFILPPSLKTLRERLTKRMSDSKEEIKKRLKQAVAEIKDYKKYDYVIINNIFECALDTLKSVVGMEKLRTENIDPRWIKKKFFKH